MWVRAGEDRNVAHCRSWDLGGSWVKPVIESRRGSMNSYTALSSVRGDNGSLCLWPPPLPPDRAITVWRNGCR